MINKRRSSIFMKYPKQITKREDLEIQKLEIEISELKRSWLRKNVISLISALSPIIIAILTFSAGIWTGFFDQKKLQLEQQSLRLINQNDSLDSIIQFKSKQLLLLNTNIQNKDNELKQLKNLSNSLQKQVINEKMIRFENYLNSDSRFNTWLDLYKYFFLSDKVKFYNNFKNSKDFDSFIKSSRIKLISISNETYNEIMYGPASAVFGGKYSVLLVADVGGVILIKDQELKINPRLKDKLSAEFLEIKEKLF